MDPQFGDFTAEWCSSSSFLVATDPTAPTVSVDVASIPNPDIGYPLEYAQGLGGPLTNTSGATAQAQYSLSPNDHIFLFQRQQAGGLALGTPFIELPPDDDGIEAPATVPLPDLIWTDFRIFDAGQCSAFFPWPAVATELGVLIDQVVGGAIPHHMTAPITSAGMSINPVFAGIADAPYGLLEPRDRIHYSTSFTAASIGLTGVVSCSNVTVTLAGDIAIGSETGFNVGPTTRRSDAAVLADAGLGHVCVPTADGGHMSCTLPIAPTSAGGEWTSHVWTLPIGTAMQPLFQWAGSGTPDEFAHLETAFETVECFAIRDHYECTLPRFALDPDGGCCPGDPTCPLNPLGHPGTCTDPVRQSEPSPFPADTTTNYQPWTPMHRAPRINCHCDGTSADQWSPGFRLEQHVVLPGRPVDWVEGSKDITGTLDAPTVNVISGAPSCLIPEVISEQITSHFSVAQRQAASALGRFLSAFGTSAHSTFGIPAAQLQSCSTDDDCHLTPQFGGLRDTCAGARVGVPDSGLCDGIRLEPRRVSVTPHGLEFVLAQTAVDPQMPLFTAGPYRIPGDSATVGQPLLSCAPTRQYPTFTPQGGSAVTYSLTSYAPHDISNASTTGGGGNHQAILPVTSGSGTFCTGNTSTDHTNCICPDSGSACDALPLSIAGYSAPPGARCTPSPSDSTLLQCCTGSGAARVCAAHL
jgi:hypothetical protein